MIAARRVLAAAGVAAVVIVSIVASGGCGKSGPKAAPHHPVAILGGDGLEWRVMRPLLHAGKLPNLKALIERGTAGYLNTFKPTLSPIVWTSIATGKPWEEHGIREFLDKSQVPSVPFTSNARRGKALWNIASDYGLRTLCVGWWITWPAERINGYMVAPYASAGQNDQNWKGNFAEDVPDQTWPRDLIDEVLPIAKRYAKDSPDFVALRSRLFDDFDLSALPAVSRERIGQTMWSAVADAAYSDMSVLLLDKMRGEDASPDLTLVYLGGTDVSSHRYWKFGYPEEFEFEVPKDEVALFHATIDRFYQEFDARIGAIVAKLPKDTNVIVCSDHGFHATEQNNPDSPFSGHHGSAPPGVFIAAGPDIQVHPKAKSLLDPAFTGPPPTLGKVMEIAPLVLYLLGIPVPRNFNLPANGGPTIERNVKPELLKRRPIDFSISSHDVGFRSPSRSTGLTDEATNDMREWMRQNGYIEGASERTEEVNPTPEAESPANPAKSSPIDYASVVRPLLDRYCVECHGEKKQKGGVRYDRWNGRIAGVAEGDLQPVIVPGKPEASELVRRIELPPDSEDAMPPAGRERPSPDEIAILRRWVLQGAVWPKD